MAGQVVTGKLYIKPGSLWKNLYCESFNGKLRRIGSSSSLVLSSRLVDFEILSNWDCQKLAEASADSKYVTSSRASGE